MVAVASGRGRNSGLPWARAHNLMTQKIKLLRCIHMYVFSIFFHITLLNWYLLLLDSLGWLLLGDNLMEEEQTLSFTQSCAESRVQSAHEEDTCTALFSWKQSQNEAISSLPVATQHSSREALFPLLAYCHGPFAYISLAVFLAFWPHLPACSLVAPLHCREKTTRQHPSPLRSRNTSTAFKQRFGWFLLHLKWSHSKNELLMSLHCHYSIIYGYLLSEEGDQDSEGSQGQDLQGVAEVTWLVQLGEEKAEGWPHRSLQLPQGGWRRGRCWSPLSGDQG